MNCPVCKYSNPAGATHCGMCYEVFNRSAAQAYLHAVKRDRQQTEEKEAPKIVASTENLLDKAGAALQKIDWPQLRKTAVSLLKRSKMVWVIGGVVLGVWLGVGALFNPNLWFHLFGKKFTYGFSEKAPAQYLVGLTEEIKSWSERQGRLDTPLEQFKVEEIGNILFLVDKNAAIRKDQKKIIVRPREWIQLLHDEKGSESHTIAQNHPSLAPAQAIFTKNGALLARQAKLSPRVAKGLPFLTPKFPAGSLRRGQTWEEPVEWLDVYNDWRIYWTGNLHWTLGELEPCGEDTCARLTYTADLHSRLWEAPGWAGKRVHMGATNVSSEGTALFDTAHKRLVSNTFTYDGLLHLPIQDLGLIPWSLRIGRRVKGPGEIIIRFENKIDVRKN